MLKYLHDQATTEFIIIYFICRLDWQQKLFSSYSVHNLRALCPSRCLCVRPKARRAQFPAWPYAYIERLRQRGKQQAVGWNNYNPFSAHGFWHCTVVSLFAFYTLWKKKKLFLKKNLSIQPNPSCPYNVLLINTHKDTKNSCCIHFTQTLEIPMCKLLTGHNYSYAIFLFASLS